MQSIITRITRYFALICALGLTTSAWAAAPVPVVVWDGAAGSDYDFRNLTHDGYTLVNLGEGYANSVAADYSYLQIGNDDKKAAIVLKKSDNTKMGDSTVIIKCENMMAKSGANRAVLSFLNGNNPHIGVAQENTTGDHTSSFIWNNAIWNNNANVRKQDAFSGSKMTIALAYSYDDGTEYYVDGTSICASGDLRSNTFSPAGACIGGVGADESTKFYAMKGMKITAIAFFSSHLSDDDVATYLFPSDIQTITVNADTSVSAIKAQLDSGNYKAIAVSAADGVTITVDEAFGCIASVSSEGNVKLAAAEQPAASYFSGVDFSGVQGALLRSWINNDVVGFNFNESQGSDTSTALVSGTWASDSSSGTGSSTALFDDALSKLSWTSRGYHQWGDTTSFIHGYLDDNISKQPSITLSNVPYETYDVIIYCATDSGSNYKFSAKQVNGTYYTWNGSATVSTADSTAAWGQGGNSQPAYGTNVLRVKNLSGALNIKGGPYRSDSTAKYRGSIAAIQLVKISTYEATISSDSEYSLTGLFSSVNENDNYVINVNESASLNIASATTIGSLTINIASGKTLTITGSALTVSNGIINISGSSGFVKMSSSLLLGTFVGDATVIYSGAVPTSSSRNANFTSSGWEGVVWVENITTGTALRISDWVSANSKVKLTNVLGHLPGIDNSGVWTLDYNGSTLGELVLENTDSSGMAQSYAFCKNDGWSKDNTHDSYCKFSKLSGSGTLTEKSGKTQTPCFVFEDGSEFTGVIEATQGMGIVFGSSSSSFASKRIAIDANEEVTIPDGSTWSASSGFYVSGTLNANGTSDSAITVNDGGVLNVASTASLTGAISGEGTVVGNQCFPVPGSSFTGTLTINAASAPSYTESSATAIYGSVLNIASGMAYLSGNVTHLPDAINIANNSHLFIGNADMASLMLNIDSIVGTGMLYISEQCTSLAALTINAGTNRGFANSNFAITPSTTLSTVNIVLDEVKGEGGTITLTSATGLPSVEGRTYNFMVNRVDGTPVTGTYDSAASTVSYTPAISGAATDIDWDFTDGEDDDLEQAPSDVDKDHDDSENTPLSFYTDAEDSTKTGVYIKHHPYITGAASFMGDNSAAMSVAVVGTMPATQNTIFLNVGSAYANQYGLVFLTTATPNEVLIGYNYGGKVTPITPMTVPNSTTARHSYIVTKEDGDSTTTFTVYLDGIKWKTVTTASKIVFASSNSGVQVGSDFGGNIRQNGYSAASDDVGVLNVLRVYGRIITEAEIAVYADTFPYVSPNGASSRTFATAEEDWVETTDTDWANTSGGTTTQETAPAANASVTVTADTATEITVNLANDTQYEALIINGSAVTLAKGTNSGKISVTGMTVIGAPVTVKYGAADFTGGPMTITEDGTITFDYSAYDISGIYKTTDIPLTSDVAENAAKVFLTVPTATYQTASLVYTSGHYAMHVTPVHEAGTELYYRSGYWSSTENSFSVVDSTGAAAPVFPGDVVVIDSTHATVVQAWIADTFPANVTSVRIATDFTFHSGVSAAIFGGVTVAVNEGFTLTLNNSNSQNSITLGAVTLNGPGSVAVTDTIAVSGAVSGTAALTISGTVNVASGGSIANAVAGSGTITYAAIPAVKPSSFTGWTGTVVLPQLDSIGGDTFSFNSYGIEGSTVRVSGIGGGWIKNEEVNPTIDIPEGVTLKISKFSPSHNNTFKALSGAGTFAVTYETAIDTTSDSWLSNYSAYFLVKNVKNFSGSLSTATPGIVIGSAKPPYNTPGGKIYLNLVGATLADSASPVPETTLEGYYVKKVGRVYSLKEYTGFMLMAY